MTLEQQVHQNDVRLRKLEEKLSKLEELVKQISIYIDLSGEEEERIEREQQEALNDSFKP